MYSISYQAGVHLKLVEVDGEGEMNDGNIYSGLSAPSKTSDATAL